MPSQVARVQPGIECRAVVPAVVNADMSGYPVLVLHLPDGRVVQVWLSDCRKVLVQNPAAKNG